MTGAAHVLSWSGAVLGAVLGLGLVLIWKGLPRNRRATLDDRLLPYLRDAPRPSRLLSTRQVGGGEVRGIPSLRLVQVSQVPHLEQAHLAKSRAEFRIAHDGFGDVEERVLSGVALELVLLLQCSDDALVVSAMSDEGLVGDAFRK